KAHITAQSLPRARQVLTKALNGLQERGYIEQFTELPKREQGTFHVYLTRSLPHAQEPLPTADQMKRHKKSEPRDASTSRRQESPIAQNEDSSTFIKAIVPGEVSSAYYNIVRITEGDFLSSTLLDELCAWISGEDMEGAPGAVISLLSGV